MIQEKTSLDEPPGLIQEETSLDAPPGLIQEKTRTTKKGKR